MEQRLQNLFGTTDSDPHAITLRDALTTLASLCLMHYQVDEKKHGDETAKAKCQPEENPNGTGCDPAGHDVDRRSRRANETTVIKSTS